MNNCDGFFPAAFTMLGVLFGLTGGAWCRFGSIPVNLNYVDPTTGEAPVWLSQLPPFQVGLFMRRYTEFLGIASSGDDVTFVFQNTCIAYSDAKDADSMWLGALSLQVISWAFGVIIATAMMSSMCCDFGFSKNLYRMLGIALIVFCSFFQAIVFIAYDSNMCRRNPDLVQFFGDNLVYQSKCELSQGGIMVIVATVVYLLAGIMCFFVRGHDGSDGEAPAKDDEVEAAE